MMLVTISPFKYYLNIMYCSFNSLHNIHGVPLGIDAIMACIISSIFCQYSNIYDDEIIGVKSTSIKFKENYKIFIGLCYFVCVLFLIILGFLEGNAIYYFTFLIFPVMHLFYQMTRLDKNNSNSCLIVFKSNNFFGFLVFLTLIATNI